MTVLWALALASVPKADIANNATPAAGNGVSQYIGTVLSILSFNLATSAVVHLCIFNYRTWECQLYSLSPLCEGGREISFPLMKFYFY